MQNGIALPNQLQFTAEHIPEFPTAAPVVISGGKPGGAFAKAFGGFTKQQAVALQIFAVMTATDSIAASNPEQLAARAMELAAAFLAVADPQPTEEQQPE